jgi:hypothetical protein
MSTMSSPRVEHDESSPLLANAVPASGPPVASALLAGPTDPEAGGPQDDAENGRANDHKKHNMAIIFPALGTAVCLLLIPTHHCIA